MNAFPPPPPFPGPGAGGFPPPVATTTSGKAIAALVLAIAGFLCCPVVFSVLAIILGKQARGEISSSPLLEGDGLAQAGFILGIIGLVLGVVSTFGWIAYMIVTA